MSGFWKTTVTTKPFNSFFLSFFLYYFDTVSNSSISLADGRFTSCCKCQGPNIGVHSCSKRALKVHKLSSPF